MIAPVAWPGVTWTHPDGRRIDVYPDRKIRSGFFERDEWRVLYRSQVPTLTEEEWYGEPPGGDPPGTWTKTEG